MCFFNEFKILKLNISITEKELYPHLIPMSWNSFLSYDDACIDRIGELPVTL